MFGRAFLGAGADYHMQVDHFFISHYHDPEVMEVDEDLDADSASSVIIRKPGSRLSSLMGNPSQNLLFSNQVWSPYEPREL